MTSVLRRWLASPIVSIVLVLIGICSPSAFAQVQAPAAAISFSLDFPQSIPDHYEISVSFEGRATYDSTGKLTPDSEPGDPFHLDFTISPATCNRIFDLAAKANYFEGQIDSGKHNLASTGAKVLTYNNGARHTQAAYNYSPVHAVQEITAIFQNMSSTLEFGRRLDYYHHHQKLALDEETKRMEQMANEKNLEEIQAIAPILQKIIADPSVLNITRSRAQRLLNARVTAASH
ncbi:MAG: hypothetical protein WA637_13940 [Terriglobales bacterium]